MGVNFVSTTCILSFIFFIVHSQNLLSAQPYDGSIATPILLRGTSGQRFDCGFYCNGNCESYLFAIFLVQTNSISHIVSSTVSFPQVVWSANRDHPVKVNATLQLTLDGDLVLRDADGSVAWSSKTAGKSVVGLNLTDTGNLILFNKQKAVVWQSFDHPTDALVPGQKLITSVSKTDSRVGLPSLVVNDKGLFAYIQSNPPQTYYELYMFTGGEQ